MRPLGAARTFNGVGVGLGMMHSAYADVIAAINAKAINPTRKYTIHVPIFHLAFVRPSRAATAEKYMNQSSTVKLRPIRKSE
jgi:hypothetical protein